MKQEEWELLAKHLADELNSKEQEEFDNWLTSSELNQKLTQKAKKVWKKEQDKRSITDLEFLKSIDSNPDKVWLDIQTSINDSMSSNSRRPWFYGVAASFLLLVGLSLLWLNNYSVGSITGNDYHEISAINGPKLVELEDGSRIWLNQGASLDFPETFGPEERKVRLNGEGYFDIHRDESRPFIIQTITSTVQVLGTSFNLKAGSKKEFTKVVVTSGSVSLSKNNLLNEKIILTKGQLGILTPFGELIKETNNDLNFLSWKTGILIFENQPLDKVLKTISEHYSIKVVVQNQQTTSRPLTASFDNQSIEEVLNVIADVHDLTINKSERGFTLN